MLKSVLTGALLLDPVCYLLFSKNLHFFHSVLVLTSVVSVVSLRPSEEDEVTSSNFRFREFVDIIYHFCIIFSFRYTL